MKKKIEKDHLPDNARQFRLNRYLAMAEVGSRRKCDQYIQEGRVQVNDKIVTVMGTRINPRKDIVKFDGNIVKPAHRLIYILLNKPPRTVCTAKDERGRRTVIDLVGAPERIYPVGRLDFNTTGALLLTNDGEMTYYLAHPRFEIKKVYRALLNKHIRPVDLHYFRNGIVLDGKKTAPCRAEELRIIDNCSYLEIELHEGRNRQIRRMFQALGYEVEELERIEFAGLRVNDLKLGEWRRLTPEELSHLKEIVKKFRRTKPTKELHE